MLNELLTDSFYGSDEMRQLEQKKQYDCYIGDIDAIKAHLTLRMSNIWSNESISSMLEALPTFLNITKRVIDSIAVNYINPARRIVYLNGVENPELTKYVKSIYPEDVAIKDRLAHRLARLHNVSLSMFAFSDGRFIQNVHPSYFYTVEVNEDNELIEVSYPRYFSINGDTELYDVVWTNGEHFLLSKDGKTIDKENPYNILPVAILRINPSSTDFWGEGQNFLVNENLTIDELITKANYEDLVLGTTGVLVGIDMPDSAYITTADGKKTLKIGRSSIVGLQTSPGKSTPPDLKYVSTQSQIESIMRTIDWKIRMLALSFGLNPAMFSADVTSQSGISRIILMKEQLEQRTEDSEQCLLYERNRFNVIRTMNNSLVDKGFEGLVTIPEDAELMVDFVEIDTPMTIQDLWIDRNQRELRGMASPITWLMNDNTDIKSVEHAIQILKTNKELNEKYGTSVSLGSRLDNQLNRTITQDEVQDNG